MSDLKKENTKAPVKNRHRLMMILLALLIMLTVVAIVATSVIIFNRTTRDYREKIIIDASKLAAEQIDGSEYPVLQMLYELLVGNVTYQI